MKEWLHRRPWIWIVIGYGAFLIASIVSVIIALRDPPIPV